MSKPRQAAIGALLAASLAACAGAAAADHAIEPTGDLPDVEHLDLADAAAVADVVTRLNAVGAELLATAPDDENLVISPASLAFAFGMLAEGASGAGESELAAFLGAGGQDRTEALNALATSLAQYAGDLAKFDPTKPPDAPFVHVANNIVLDDELVPNNDYLVRLHQWYDAPASTIDLGAEESKAYLDEWVRTNTAGLIKESAIRPDPNLRLVLQNAVLFGASWRTEFDPADTYNEPFAVPSGPVDVPTMHKTLYVPYAESEGWAAVALPYTEGFTAIVVLPPPGTDPVSLDDDLRVKLTEALGGETVQVEIALPKVDVATKLDLAAALPDLGVTAIFSDLAALDGIAEADLVVGQAFQQAKLQIDEAGTVAAAVTEIGVEATSAPSEAPITFIVDRPYLFTVSHDTTGLDLFTAAIRDPRE